MAFLTMVTCLFSRKHLPTWVMHSWGKILLAMAGIRLHIEGMEHIQPDKPSIYMPNHASIMDIPVLAAALPVHLRFIFKQSILFIPLVGQVIWLMGMIPINRTSRAKAIASINKAGERVRKGYDILIFPEGTRTRHGEILPFKKGGFVLATSNQIDIVPISLSHTRQLCGVSSIFPKQGTVEIVIHPRITAEAYSNLSRDELMTSVRHQIVSGLRHEQPQQSKMPVTT